MGLRAASVTLLLCIELHAAIAFSPLPFAVPSRDAARRGVAALRCSAEPRNKLAECEQLSRRSFARLAGAALLALSGAGSVALSPVKVAAASSPRAETVLVVGAKSMVGAAVLTQLLKQGNRVRALTRNPDEVLPLDELPSVWRDIEWVGGDLNHPASIPPAVVKGVTRIIYCPGAQGYKDPENTRRIYEEGIDNLIALAKAHGGDSLKRVVYFSSDGTDPPPEGFPLGDLLRSAAKYKRRGEGVVRHSGVEYSIVRAKGLSAGFYLSRAAALGEDQGSGFPLTEYQILHKSTNTPPAVLARAEPDVVGAGIRARAPPLKEIMAAVALARNLPASAADLDKPVLLSGGESDAPVSGQRTGEGPPMIALNERDSGGALVPGIYLEDVAAVLVAAAFERGAAGKTLYAVERAEEQSSRSPDAWRSDFAKIPADGAPVGSGGARRVWQEDLADAPPGGLELGGFDDLPTLPRRRKAGRAAALLP